jgi:hypothetical protein
MCIHMAMAVTIRVALNIVLSFYRNWRCHVKSGAPSPARPNQLAQTTLNPTLSVYC